MTLLKTILSTIACVLSLNACASRPTDNTATQQNDSNPMKAVIVYFTHSGNTELAARDLAAVTGAPAIRLMPALPYTSEDVDWTDNQSRCTLEHLDQSLRPALKPVDIDFSEVDTVFIGFPIWWHEEPAIIRTFLDDYSSQLAGKVLYPFCTSYESPMSEADTNLQKGYPALHWKTGLRLPASPERLKAWIAE